jgi:tetratricopeptide (TPR) repeat protein
MSQMFAEALSFYIKTLPVSSLAEREAYFKELFGSFDLLQKPQSATQFLCQNLSSFENNSDTVVEYGAHLLVMGYANEACTLYEHFLQKWPNRVNALNNLAIAHKRLGRVELAKKVFAHILSLDASHTSAWTNLASIFHFEKNYSQAQVCFEKSIALDPNNFRNYVALAECLKSQNEFQKALQVHLICVQKFGGEYDAHLLLGNFFANLKHYDKAVQAYLNAIKIDNKRTQAYNNIGVAYKELGRNDEALKSYEAVLLIRPNDAATHNNLGNLLRTMGDIETALTHLKLAIELNPSYADAYSNIGAIYKEAKDNETAKTYYEKAIELNPEHTNANFDLGLLALVDLDYEKGWKLYEHRLKMQELIAKTHVYKVPIWNGEPLDGKIIILQNEQGFGDNIMFIRYVPYFVALGATVVIRSRADLVALFLGIEGVSQVISEDEPLVQCDYYLPLLSCAERFRTLPQSIPNQFPYIFLPDEPIDFTLDMTSLNVGLIWSCSRTHKDFVNRYVGLESYRPLLDIEGINWYSLQLGDDAQQIVELDLAERIHDCSGQLTDFAKTAALISKLDLVITTDSSVFHLCGAMDKAVWVMTPKFAEWRMMQTGENTPWYRSARLFRQTERSKWGDVVERIKNELVSLVKAKRS